MSKFLALAAAWLLAGAAVAQSAAPAKIAATNKRGKAAAAHATPAAAGPDWSVTYAARITPLELKQDLGVLASDEYEGRATGQKGQKMAADYLAKAFAAAGLTGPVPGSDNAYFQHFNLERTVLDPVSSIKIGNRTFVVNQDFYVVLRDPAAAATTSTPTFVGYGINTPGYADFAINDPQLQQQDLVLLVAEPLTPAGQPLLGQGGQPSPYGRGGTTEMVERSLAIRTLAPRSTIRIMPSAAALARVRQDYPGVFAQAPVEEITLPGEQEPVAKGTNVFFVSPDMGAALLGTTAAGLADYQRAVAAAGKPVAAAFRPAAMQLQITKKTELLPTENVLGYLEGSDKKNEVVVVSAHYDHVGIRNGVVYNGADDDGSGTVSVLAMARAFAQAKKEGHGPCRSLLFLANVAEEIGLLGSRYYTDHPVLPLATTVADLHLDMVGRVDSVHQGQGDYLYLLGDNWLSPDLRALSEATNQRYQPLGLDYAYNSIAHPTHLYYRSDHYNFSKHQVPVIFYFSGFHADYHQPTDDVAKIDFPALTRRTRHIFHTAWAVANRATRPAIAAQHRSTGFAPAADLARYVGTYTSRQMGLQIAISQQGATLSARPTTQYAQLPLEAVSQGVFKCDEAGLRFRFEPDRPAFALLENGKDYLFTKD